MLFTILLYLTSSVAFFMLMTGTLRFADELEQSRKAASAQLLRPKLGDGVSPWLRDLLISDPLRRFDSFIRQCGKPSIQTGNTIVFMLFANSVTMLVLDLVFARTALSLLGGIFLGTMLPLWVLVRIRRARLLKLTQQLPEAIDMLVRCLRAGHPIPFAVQTIAKEMPDPISSEFKMVSDSMAFGADLRDALGKMAQQIPVSEFKYLVSLIKIQQATGGNLADVLSALANMIRQKQKLAMKVRAISAESRLSGRILAALPIAIPTVIGLLNPKFYSAVSESRGLEITLGFGAFLILVGILSVRRITRIRV